MWYMHVAISMSESEAEERARSDKKLNDRFELDMRIAEEEFMMDMELQPPSHESVRHTPSWLLAFARRVYSEGYAAREGGVKSLVCVAARAHGHDLRANMCLAEVKALSSECCVCLVVWCALMC